jgi:hypothetical protein
MAQVVIVTRQCYLVAESINHISVHEMDEEDKADSLFYVPPTRKNRRRRKLTPKQELLEKLKRAAQLYQININFTPLQSSPQNGISKHNNGNDSVTITVRGYDRALELYHDMINQIREQIPDRLWLDKLVESFFTQNPLEPEAK